MKITLTKKCIVCGKKFAKPIYCSLPEWFGNKRRPNGRRFCSVKCGDKNKIGKPAWNKGVMVRTNTGRTHFKKGQRPSIKTEFKKGQTPWNKGRKWTKAERKKISDSLPKRFGKKAGNWKGGITKIAAHIRTIKEYSKWRTAVFQRDNYTCKECNARRKKGDRVVLQSHHIKPFYKILEENNIKTIQQAKDCKELWETSNGKTLCISCHKQTDSYLVNQHTL